MGNHEPEPLEQQIAAAEGELRIHEALAVVLADPHGLLDVVARASDSAEARTAVQERFGLDEIQATAALDLQVRRVSRRERERIVTMRDDLVARLAELRRRQTSG